MIKYYLWGAGEVGRRLFHNLDDRDVLGYIDSDPEKQNGTLNGKRVISPESYFKNYSNEYIVISTYQITSIEAELQENEVYCYFLCTDFPPVYLDNNKKDFFIEYIFNHIQNVGKQAVYGLSLFSLYLVEEVKKRVGKYPDIILDKKVPFQLIEKLQKDFSEVNFIGIEHISEYNVVYNTSKCVDVLNHAEKADSVRIVEMRNCEKDIEAFWNRELKRFMNKHKNKRCFIIGTGPSLMIEDLNTLYKNDEICFGVNSIYKCYDRTSWRPYYYVITDSKFMEANKEEIKRLESKQVFLGDVNGNQMIDECKKEYGDQYESIHIMRDFYYNGYPRFSDDPSKVLYWGMTVVYACLQLAVYMGFSEIYLLGVDCNYIKGSKKNYFIEEKHADNMEHNEHMMVNAYHSAEEYSKAHGIKIYNATRGGKIEVFRRVTFDSLFDK